MPNKYSEESRAARDANHRLKSCESKVAFETEEAAYQKGQTTYQCKYCGKFHRSGSFAKFVASVKKRTEHCRKKRRRNKWKRK